MSIKLIFDFLFYHTQVSLSYPLALDILEEKKIF